ncbi:MAG: glycyl radical protein, partial [Treponema sp.]|nr:glycyl radical protein [Treponema sp.]
PDGRKSEVSLANGFSPAQGADVKGPTALINSIVKNDLSSLGNGMVLDLKFQPRFFSENEQGIKALIRTYFALGGYEIQLNVVDKHTLTEAQKYPERYKNLIVRVSGFSAYFTDLNAALQNEIIARTEYGY